MDSNAGNESTQRIEGPGTKTTGGAKPLHRFLRGEPRTVGIVLLFLGLCLFLFGIPLKGDSMETSAESYSPFWLGTLYFICGVLYIQSERNTTKKIMQIYSLEAVFLFHSLVAGIILIAMSVFARLALRSSHTQRLCVHQLDKLYKMPSLVLTSSNNSNNMEDVDEGLDINTEIKKKKDKTKKKSTPTDESADCDPPAPKKLKRAKMDTANGTVQISPDVNGNVGKKAVKKKKKKKKKTLTEDDATAEQTPAANGISAKVNEQLNDTTQSMEDSSSESEKDVWRNYSRKQGTEKEKGKGRVPKVLVLAPTRELAIQVSKDFKDITKKLSVHCFYGGSSYNPQVDAIRSGIDVLVGTPGRIKDHLQNNKLDLSQLKHVVLDEVDQMLDMGFADQVEEILSASYKKGDDSNPQTLLFSATCPPWVYDVAKKYMRPQCVHVDLIGKKSQKAATTVEHLAIACHWSQRAAVIGDVVRVYSGSHGRAIVFCETKKEAHELSMNTSIKQSAQSLHGDIPQKQRELTLKGFRNGNFEVLVATNVAARGLDIPEVDLVVQCSPPKDVESYIHRSGRTGRAGRTGICICFYQRKEEDQLRYVEQKAGITFKRVGVPTANDIIKSSSKDAVRFLDSVPPSAVEHFRAAAERLIEERGAVEALAAALAHISGATSLEQRSLLNSDALPNEGEGVIEFNNHRVYTTLVLNCSLEMHNIGFAWRGLKEQLGEEIDEQIKRKMARRTQVAAHHRHPNFPNWRKACGTAENVGLFQGEEVVVVVVVVVVDSVTASVVATTEEEAEAEEAEAEEAEAEASEAEEEEAEEEVAEEVVLKKGTSARLLASKHHTCFFEKQLFQGLGRAWKLSSWLEFYNFISF
ncbi:Nucleolar RNA helicase 2 [Bagarius yarrelli]|uniref:RNA helicase n=1 Tax=Bagarius yarrelli TaxID=175774 RepID=A0A556UY79_BAGYA|nr:Nucleolar RNA helicase 2 [Bagarius yarrelli]